MRKSFYSQNHPNYRNSIYLTLVPSSILTEARQLQEIINRHEFDITWNLKPNNYRKVTIRLSDHLNNDDYYDYDDFIYYFDLEKIKKDGLNDHQIHKLKRLIDDGEIASCSCL